MTGAETGPGGRKEMERGFVVCAARVAGRGAVARVDEPRRAEAAAARTGTTVDGMGNMAASSFVSACAMKWRRPHMRWSHMRLHCAAELVCAQ